VNIINNWIEQSSDEAMNSESFFFLF